jgi:PAS domain S-box-containing protein
MMSATISTPITLSAFRLRTSGPITNAIATIDLQGRFLYVNPRMEQLSGYRADEMIGQPVTRLIPAERPDEEPGTIPGA